MLRMYLEKCFPLSTAEGKYNSYFVLVDIEVYTSVLRQNALRHMK
jgi:hypothetical protein